MKLEERKSPEYYKRRELMKDLTVPTMTNVKANLGLPLALIVFEQCDDSLKEDLGLSPHLKGPSGELWSSPSDLLIGKVCLKPPLTQKHIQALTHEGILDIGSQIEKKYWNEMEIQKTEALQEKEEQLRRIFEIEKTRILAEALENERHNHQEEMETMKKSFEKKIDTLIWECGYQIMELEKEMQNDKDTLNAQWKDKLETEISFTIQRITEEFLEKMRLQEQVLAETFGKQIENLNAKYKCAIELEKVKCKEMVVQLRHHLECQNIANLIYVLCKERRKCKGEKEAIEKYYKKEIKQHKSKIKEEIKTNRTRKNIIQKREKQLKVREKILIEILRQFKKFIYYALKAAPTQGEFLLNIDKLIKWELDDYCIEKTKKISMPAISRKKSSKGEIPVIDANDYLESHMLWQEDAEEEMFNESDVLPAFYFDEKMYVREDFRDMFSAGITINNQHPLWNRDVAELLNIFKESIGKKRSNLQSPISGSKLKLKSHLSSVHFNPEKLDQINQDESGSDIIQAQSLNDIPDPNGSTVLVSVSVQVNFNSPLISPTSSKFIMEEVLSEEKEIRKTSINSKLGSVKKSSIVKKADAKKVKPVVGKDRVSIATVTNQTSVEIRPKIRKPSLTQSKLTLARDSVILTLSTLDKKSLQNLTRTSSESTSPREEHKTSLLSQNEEVQRSIVSKDVEELDGVREAISIDSLQNKRGLENARASKLVLAQDSIELMKSVMGLTGSTIKKEKKIMKKGKSGKKATFVKSTKPTVSTPHKKTIKPSAAVVGLKQLQGQEKPIEEFTDERIKSLVNLIKENPSLIRLFTACSN